MWLLPYEIFPESNSWTSHRNSQSGKIQVQLYSLWSEFSASKQFGCSQANTHGITPICVSVLWAKIPNVKQSGETPQGTSKNRRQGRKKARRNQDQGATNGGTLFGTRRGKSARKTEFCAEYQNSKEDLHVSMVWKGVRQKVTDWPTWTNTYRWKAIQLWYMHKELQSTQHSKNPPNLPQ